MYVCTSILFLGEDEFSFFFLTPSYCENYTLSLIYDFTVSCFENKDKKELKIF